MTDLAFEFSVKYPSGSSVSRLASWDRTLFIQLLDEWDKLEAAIPVDERAAAFTVLIGDKATAILSTEDPDKDDILAIAMSALYRMSEDARALIVAMLRGDRHEFFKIDLVPRVINGSLEKCDCWWQWQQPLPDEDDPPIIH